MKQIFLSQRKKDCRGFTIVELMLGMVIAAILVLTMAAILWASFSAWRKNSDAVEIQRDATFAMDMISRAIRPASASEIDSPTRQNTQNNPAGILTINKKSFYRSVSYPYELMYDPDTSVAGNEEVLIRDRLDSLEFINNYPLKSITVTLNLTQGSQNILVDKEVITYRN